MSQKTTGNIKYNFDEALDLTGTGKYNYLMLTSCCLLILAMYLDIFGFSVVLPVAACDLGLSTNQQAILSAVPLIGVMICSYPWGLCADLIGRRRILLAAMFIGVILNLIASMAPGFGSLAAFKLLSAGFTSSANAAGFVLLGESTPAIYRNRFMFFMASATMCVQFIICIFALPVFNLTFNIDLGFTQYRPWRLLMQIISIPGALGLIMLVFLHESPKYALSKGNEGTALNILENIFKINNKGSFYQVKSLLIEKETKNKSTNCLNTIKDQTLPLFRPPLLKNSLKLYYILLSAYMTSTGFTMWVPTITNAYYNGGDSSGLTFCQVAHSATSVTNQTNSATCDEIIKESTLYAVMCYSGVSTTLNIIISFVVGLTGKKLLTIIIFAISITAEQYRLASAISTCFVYNIIGIALVFVKIPILSICLFFIFLYVALVLGNINSYLVEVNPTHLRGMATSISIIVARGFGFASIQVIAALLEDNCQPMLLGYIILQLSGGVVSFFLPNDDPAITKKTNQKELDTTSL